MKLKVLINEDGPELLEAISIVFESLGCTVFPTRSAAEALKFVRTSGEHIDLFITDKDLSDDPKEMDGIELIHTAKAEMDARFWLMTGRSFSIARDAEAKLLSFARIIPKPPKFEELKQFLKAEFGEFALS